jgi:hypothetical protein
MFIHFRSIFKKWVIVEVENIPADTGKPFLRRAGKFDFGYLKYPH